MTTPGEVGDAWAADQRAQAHRDAFTAARDMTVHIGAHVRAEDARRGGLGLLAPPLGRLPERVRGRDALLERLTALADRPDGRAHVLAGLGGTGKSTVALGVAEHALEQGRPVWWVPATDAALLSSALLGLAQALGADAGQVDAARAGRIDPSDVVWLMLEAHPGWVLVIDNADDLRALSVSGRPVRDGNGWVRASRAGLVVVTSRDADPRHWGRKAELHPVGWLSEEDGGSVLLDLAPSAGPRGAAEELSARLGGLALALHHAGSQLSSPFASLRTFKGYREALETESPALLLPAGDLDDREGVTSTWEVSLDQLADAGVPQARGLLRVLAWLAPAVPIPVDGLDHDVLGRVCADAGGADVAAGLEALLSVGLIENRLASGTAAGLMVHPLVAETTRSRIAADDAERAAAGAAVALMIAATAHLNADVPAHWPMWDAWLPHLHELLAHASSLLGEDPLEALAKAAADAARTLVWAGSYAASLEVAQAGLRHTRRLGVAHPATLALQFWRASAHRFMGRTVEAERLFREVLAASERVLGRDHPDTLGTRHEVARVVAERGDVGEAERLLREVLAARERVLGRDHPNTLTTRHAVAWVVAGQGDAGEAERLFREVLAARERVLGRDHPDTQITARALRELTSSQEHVEGD